MNYLVSNFWISNFQGVGNDEVDGGGVGDTLSRFKRHCPDYCYGRGKSSSFMYVYKIFIKN